MKKIVRKVVEWQCKVCKSRYNRKPEVRECESKPIIPPEFKVGQLVRLARSRAPERCEKCGKTYVPVMRITAILGPRSDIAGDVWGQKGDLRAVHRFWYRAAFSCPGCGRRDASEFRTETIEPISKPRAPKPRKKSA